MYTVAAGYTTAVLAPNRKMFHAIVLGIIGVLLTILSSIGNFILHLTPLSSTWYPVALILITLPCTWIGWKLRLVRRAK